MTGRPLGWVYAALLLQVWVGFHLVSRLGVQTAMTTWDLAALRYAGALAAGLAVLAARRPGGLAAAWPKLPAGKLIPVVALAGFGFPLFAYAGYRLAPAAHGATVMAAGLPVIASLLGAALGQGRITAARAASLGIVVAGSVLLAIATSGVWAGAWRGDLLFLGAVASWAGFTVLVARWRLPALETTLTVALYAAPIFLPLWSLALPSSLDGASWSAMLFQAAFQGALAGVGAGFLFTQCVRLLGTGATTMIGAVVPGVAALLAWPLLGETLPPLGFAAIALVSVGMLAGVWSSGRDRRADHNAGLGSRPTAPADRAVPTGQRAVAAAQPDRRAGAAAEAGVATGRPAVAATRPARGDAAGAQAGDVVTETRAGDAAAPAEPGIATRVAATTTRVDPPRSRP